MNYKDDFTVGEIFFRRDGRLTRRQYFVRAFVLAMIVLIIFAVIAVVDRKMPVEAARLADMLFIFFLFIMLVWFVNINPNVRILIFGKEKYLIYRRLVLNASLAIMIYYFFRTLFVLSMTFLFILLNDNLMFNLSIGANILFRIVGFVGLSSFICLTIRRLHDMNRTAAFAYVLAVTGAFLTLSLGGDIFISEMPLEIPVFTIHSVLCLYVLLKSGARGENFYVSQ